MLLFEVHDPKTLMNAILKDTLFDSYEARGVLLHSVTRFEISCTSDKDEADTRMNYCAWGKIKPYVYELIRGKKQPKLLKILLCLSGDDALKIDSNAASLHITVTYEEGAVSVLTGCSQKNFTLDKSLETVWDDTVTRLFSDNGIQIRQNME